MSDVLEHTETGNQPVTQEDLERMLAEANGRAESLKRELDTERSTRVMTEQERDAERANRIVTEQERDGHAARVVSESEQRFVAQRDAVKNGIAAQKTVLTSAEDAYARHAEAGDWKSAATAQRQIAEAAAKITNLEAQAEFLDANKEKLVPPVQQQPARMAQQPQPTGRYAQFIQTRLEPSEQDWLDRRPKFTESAAYRAEVIAASQLAAARGNPRGTQGYFQEMEKILGETPQTETRTETPPRQQTQQISRSPSADIAPQRRASPGQQPQGGREITLTPDQVEVANALYGNPNGDGYIANEAERYKKYYENDQKMAARRGRAA